MVITNTTKSYIDKGIGYFVKNRNKSTNEQALLYRLRAAYAWAMKVINQKIM